MRLSSFWLWVISIPFPARADTWAWLDAVRSADFCYFWWRISRQNKFPKVRSLFYIGLQKKTHKPSKFIIKIFCSGLPPYSTDSSICSGIFVACYWEHFYFNFLGNRGLLFEVWDDASDLTEAGPGYRWQIVPNASSPVRFLSGAKKSFRYSTILNRRWSYGNHL